MSRVYGTLVLARSQKKSESYSESYLRHQNNMNEAKFADRLKMKKAFFR